MFWCCCREPTEHADRALGPQICSQQRPQDASLNGSHSFTCVLAGELVLTSKSWGAEGAGDFLTLNSFITAPRRILVFAQAVNPKSSASVGSQLP